MLTSSLLLAFGFGHLAMLGWLGAAAAPLLIHLWNRRKYREVNWAAIEFLLAALRKNARRIQIEQWILLAVRTAIVVLVVLALAEPYLEMLGVKLAHGQRRHKLFVIDGSFSMATKPGEISYFEEAKRLAARIVDESSTGDAFTLLLMSVPPRVVVAQPAFDAKDFAQELEHLKLLDGGLDLPAALVKIEEILRRTAREHPRLAQQEVYFFTDLQRVGWLPELAGNQTGEFRRQSERVAKLARLHVFDVGQQPAENLAISNIQLIESLPTVDRDLTAEIEVRNLGRQAKSNTAVELFVDGQRIDEQRVDLGSDDRAVTSFRYRFDTSGDHVVEARLAGDVLDIDNHRWLSLPVKEAIRVLCVNGKPAEGEFGQATDYLAVALSPEADARRPLIVPEVIRESALLEIDLAPFDCVFFCNVGQFTAAEAKLLDAYLRAGGGIVFFLGDQVQPESYNRFLGGEEPGSARILPAKIGAAMSEADYRLDPLGYRHPLLSVFRDQEQAGLLTTPIRRYFRTTRFKDSQAKAALGLSGGDPIILEEPIHRGHVILVATTADLSWNLMPVLPSYVPVVHELLGLAASGRIAERNLEVGQILTDDVRNQTAAEPLTVESPSGQRQTVRISAGESVWQFPDTQFSGVYTVDPPGDASPAERFAVNVNTVESDLSRLSPDELRSEVWPGVEFEHHTSWTARAEAVAAVNDRGGKVHVLLLYITLGLLLLEPALAWYFGHHRA